MPEKNYAPGLISMVDRIVFPFNTFTSQQITLDEYFQELYLEPALILISPDSTSKTQIGSGLELRNKKLVLTGAMGAGKSTYLLSLYRNYKASFEKGDQKLRPFIFSLPQYFEDKTILETIIQYKDEMILFVDSLDETISNLDRKDIHKALDVFLDYPSVIIACRSPFFYSLFEEVKRLKLDNIVQIEPLTPERQKDIIKKYLASPYLKQSNSKGNSEKTALTIISKCREKNVAETTIIATPLFSALASIVAVNQPKNANLLKGVIDVYKEFVNDIITRKFKSSEDLNKLVNIAFKLNTAQLKKDIVKLDEISKDFGEEFSEAFKDMVQTKKSSIDNSVIIIDFSHRSVGEFLLAKHIVSNLKKPKFSQSEIPSFFNRLFNYEVSFFIRSLFDQMSSTEKQHIADLFKAFIAQNLTTNQDKQILAVHNCMYFFRFLLQNWKTYALEMGDEFFAKKEQISPLIIGTFLSGVISSEAIPVQVKFLETSITSEDCRLVNRNLNYYLFYYGDSEYSTADDFTKSISETTSWDNTRTVLITRLEDDSPKKRLFRCHDLIILRQFLEKTVQNVPPLDLDALTRILSNQERLFIDVINPDIVRTIQAEIKNIKALTEQKSNSIQKKNGVATVTDNRTYIISIAPNWGYEEGGINAFNFDFNLALAKHSDPQRYKVICIAHVSPIQDRSEELTGIGGEVKSLQKSSSNPDPLKDLKKIKKMIEVWPKNSHLIFVGHDVFTGELAIHLAQEYPERSTSIVFHHMDYQSYYGMKDNTNGKEMEKKIDEQERLFAEPQVAIGVGPKLYASVLRKTTAKSTTRCQLLPGLHPIEARNDDNDKIVAITFGRYDKRTDNLKQMRLATSSFAQYVSNNRREAKGDATLQVIGISEDEDAGLLKSDYIEKAKGYINVIPLPYSTDKSKIFNKLATSNIGMMLSIHEGFGLVGLEIIAAGVPLILSENTGLYQLLSDHLTGQDLKDYGIFPVLVLGSNDGEVNREDQEKVVAAIKEVWTHLDIYKAGVMRLRKLLSEEISWERTIRDFIKIIDDKISTEKPPIE